MTRNPMTMAALAGLVALAACSERETILPGERLGVREVLQATPPEPGLPANRALAAALPAPRANAAWPQSPVSPHVRTDHAALAAAPSPLWSVAIGAGDGKRQRLNADPVSDGARIYTLSADSRVSAVTRGGQVAWSVDLTPRRDASWQGQGGGLGLGDGRLFVASGFGKLTALDPETGGRLWEQQLGGTATGAPTYRDGLVYVTSGDSVGWAIEAATGRVRWQTETVEDVANVAGAPAPALAGDRVVFGFGDGALQAALPAGGMGLWTAYLAGGRNGRVLSRIEDVTGDPVIVGDRVYAGNHTGRFAAFDLGSGEQVWSQDQGALDRPLVAGNSVYLISDLNRLVRLDAATGAQIWSVELPGWVPTRRPSRRRDAAYANHGPVLAGGRIWVASNDGGLRGFAPEDGRLTATVPVPGGATTQPIVAGQTLYVVSTRGVLHAFR
ncbi:outer membrane protein assembly factor BamB family protein [Roseivivax sp. CAU 1761]